MAEKENKEDNINTLCKKCFTPELCNEEIKESKDTLKKKIMAQLYMFGKWCFNQRIMSLSDEEKKKSPLVNRPDLTDDSIIDAIEIILKKGENKEIKGGYSSYFKAVIFDRFYKKQLLKDENHFSFDEPLNSNESSSEDVVTLHDFIEDKKYMPIDNKYESSYSVFDILQVVENAYRNKQRKKYKAWLSPVLTRELFEGLKHFCNCYGEEKIQKYTFADQSIYNLDKKPTRKSIAESFNVDPSYLKNEIEKFLLPIKEQIEENLVDIKEC
jgi:hypothetical protein